jgi:hypothetical protein
VGVVRHQYLVATPAQFPGQQAAGQALADDKKIRPNSAQSEPQLLLRR